MPAEATTEDEKPPGWIDMPDNSDQEEDEKTHGGNAQLREDNTRLPEQNDRLTRVTDSLLGHTERVEGKFVLLASTVKRFHSVFVPVTNRLLAISKLARHIDRDGKEDDVSVVKLI
ncbi:MAG: hypothetical protein ALECFALPRED_002608 [Alectoria fallacina]|uniref:Uncharacterized protein n=1 Tax=Alectoria fallacina TaxID=1903189 RepID=A0A8H3EJW6_9LECA|nr:MAG: hypothetical protein ALECFALPRED_002608 [Alectoria fallacina]